MSIAVTQPKATRTPRSADSITAGALKMTLAERVELAKALKASIEKEVVTLQEAAAVAANIAKS